MLIRNVAIPKGHTIFRFEIPQPVSTSEATLPPTEDVDTDVRQNKSFVFELHGSQFEVRATDRATKKFKQRRMDGL